VLSSAGFKDENDDDTFSSFEIEIEAGDTLATVASTINGVAGLNAYTMFDGLNYNLVIQSEKTGENFGFEASFDTTAQFDTDNTDETDAKDASVEFNGVEVTSSSNTIKDAVQGLTINAIDTDSTERNVTVDVDVTKVSEKVKAFVTNYNAMVDFINKRNTYDKETGNMGVFFGDSTIRTLVTRFNTLLTQTYSSDTDGDSDVDSDDETLLTANDTEVTLDSLSTIGIEFATDSSGKLTFTESVFKTAIIDYQQDVEALFSGPDSDGNDYSFSAQMVTELKTAIQPFTGTLAKVDSLMTDQTKSLKNQITRWETRIKSYEARLLKQFTAMEKVAGSMNTMGSFLSSFFSKKSS
jgi:flagellar hook-associated protein 2